MKAFLRILAVLAAVTLCISVTRMIVSIFKTRMTRYYKVY